MGRKRSKRGSGSSTSDEDKHVVEGDDCPNKELKDAIDCLKKLVTDGLAELHTDLDKLRYDFKADINEVKSSIRKLEDSIEFTQGEVDTLKEQVNEKSKKHATDVELLHQKVAELELKLKEEVDRNTNLEQYTRRENLRFNKIPESEDENCKAIIYDVISSLGVNTSQIRFHTVHRIGKKAEDRCRPIIARFVCREDRARVWLERGKIKQSTTYPDAYITEDYARAIQEERKKLIKAMMKARDEHGLNNVKVKGRFPYIDKDRYDHENIPGFLK